MLFISLILIFPFFYVYVTMPASSPIIIISTSLEALQQSCNPVSQRNLSTTQTVKKCLNNKLIFSLVWLSRC